MEVISHELFTRKIGNFTVSEFCVTGNPPSPEIAGAIIVYHITPLNVCRKIYGKPILVSKKAGYRPRAYEVSKGRTGNSQHNYEEMHPKGIGATDITSEKEEDLIPILIENTEYTRICHYPNNGFIHGDYKPTPSGKRELYTCKSLTSKWELLSAF